MAIKTSLKVTSIATFWSVIWGLIMPPFARSNGNILWDKLITPVINRVSDNNGNKS